MTIEFSPQSHNFSTNKNAVERALHMSEHISIEMDAVIALKYLALSHLSLCVFLSLMPIDVDADAWCWDWYFFMFNRKKTLSMLQKIFVWCTIARKYFLNVLIQLTRNYGEKKYKQQPQQQQQQWTTAPYRRKTNECANNETTLNKVTIAIEWETTEWKMAYYIIKSVE